uniref:Phosphotransferase n=1 Tax=Romanomermis culicivorax TaxID=13658 RepID=A0A915KU07_ROMCU
MRRLKISDQKLSLGFTFSFPCAQDALASGRLINWTKGFKCSDVENQDVVKLLQEAIHRRKVSGRCEIL